MGKDKDKDKEEEKEEEKEHSQDKTGISKQYTTTDILQDKDFDFDIINIDQGKKLVIDELDLDEELEEIFFSVNVSDSEKRYSLEEQAHDFLNYNIGLLKPQDKTQQNYDKINQEVNRFIE